MANLREKVDVGLENISIVLAELEKIKDKSDKTTAELTGIGTFLHNFYTGIGNILKQILHDMEIPTPSSSSWHRDSLTLASEENIITGTGEAVGKVSGIPPFLCTCLQFLIG